MRCAALGNDALPLTDSEALPRAARRRLCRGLLSLAGTPCVPTRRIDRRFRWFGAWGARGCHGGTTGVPKPRVRASVGRVGTLSVPALETVRSGPERRAFAGSEAGRRGQVRGLRVIHPATQRDQPVAIRAGLSRPVDGADAASHPAFETGRFRGIRVTLSQWVDALRGPPPAGRCATGDHHRRADACCATERAPGARLPSAVAGARLKRPARWLDGRVWRGDPSPEESPSTTTHGSG